MKTVGCHLFSPSARWMLSHATHEASVFILTCEVLFLYMLNYLVHKLLNAICNFYEDFMITYVSST